jgi:hypothetical protein
VPGTGPLPAEPAAQPSFEKLVDGESARCHVVVYRDTAHLEIGDDSLIFHGADFREQASAFAEKLGCLRDDPSL